MEIKSNPSQLEMNYPEIKETTQKEETKKAFYFKIILKNQTKKK